MSNPTPKPQIKLDRQKFDAIALALGRLEDIKNLSALATTREVEAEAIGLVEFLSKELIDYAPELLGAWFVVKAEYEPLCNSFLPLVNRANAIISQRHAAQQAQQAQQAKAAPVESSNIIKLS